MAERTITLEAVRTRQLLTEVAKRATRKVSRKPRNLDIARIIEARSQDAMLKIARAKRDGESSTKIDFDILVTDRKDTKAIIRGVRSRLRKNHRVKTVRHVDVYAEWGKKDQYRTELEVSW